MRIRSAFDSADGPALRATGRHVTQSIGGLRKWKAAARARYGRRHLVSTPSYSQAISA